MKLIAYGMDSAGLSHIANPNDTLDVAISAIKSVSGQPAVATLASAGTGATATIIGTNASGIITLNSGVSLLATGPVLTLTLADGYSFPSGFGVTFSAGNANFAGVLNKIYATSTANVATLFVTTSLSLSTTYIGQYQITGW